MLASKVAEDKVAALVSVSPDLPQDVGALFKTMVPALNGRGGGTNPAGLPEAFAALREAL